jgi:hypothetical protein
MRQALSKRSPALVVSVLALVAAVGGTAVAGDPGAATSAKLSKKKVKKLANKQITKRAPGLSVANAATLDGHPPSDFVSSARLREFDVTLNGGESRELLQAGALTFTGTCTQNATDDGGSANQDFFQIVISTAQNGALFDGFDEKRGRNPGDFLDTGTPASDRVFQEVSTSAIGPGATGVQTFESASDDGAAIAPDGARVFGRGDQLAVAFNQYGGVCRAFGIFNVLG